jgi:glycine/D-amino acid oxidase-like deaminating enzyme
MAALELMGFTRRDILTALLGAPLAAMACRRGPARGFDGAIVGQNDSLGHKLREGFSPAATSERKVAVLIIGGGIAGLSAAWRLEKAGVTDYRILELDEVPGGTARGDENEVARYPWGAHYLPAPLPHARAVIALLEEMGIASRGPDGALAFEETQLCRAPQERLFVGDRFYDGLWPRSITSEDDERQLEAFNEEIERLAHLADSKGRRAFAVPRAHGSDDADIAALDRISMADWLGRKSLGSRRLRWYVEYATRDDFGCKLEDASAWATLHYFASRLEKGKTQEFLVWPEGNARLVAHLAKGAGKRLETGAVALEVRPAEKGAEVQVFHPEDATTERIVAEQVVIALPRPFAQRLVSPWREKPPPFAGAFTYGSWLVANLTLHRAPQSRGFPLAWDNVLFGSPSLGYVVATHQLDPGACLDADCRKRAPAVPGASVWTWYYPFVDEDAAAARRRMLSLSWAECADLALSDLARAHPDIARCVSRVDVWRWGHAMVRPTPGLCFGPALAEAAKPVGDVHFAHTDLSALPLFEEAQFHGIRAAEEILARRGVAYESLL